MKSDFIDPHRGVEHTLLASGRKHLAYVVEKDRHDFSEFVVESYTFIGQQRYLIYYETDICFARKFKKSDAMFLRGSISLVNAHIRRGILLGYSKIQIKTYACGRGRYEGLK